LFAASEGYASDGGNGSYGQQADHHFDALCECFGGRGCSFSRYIGSAFR
jgi:hypothetical protein